MVSAAAPDDLRSLDTLPQERRSGGAGLALSGRVVQPGGAAAGGHPLAAEPIIEWVVQYGEQTCVWAVTAAAWYKLLAPSPRYAALYAVTLQGVALGQTALEEMRAQEGSDIAAAVERVAGNLPPGDGRRRQALPREVREFAVSQVEARLGRRRKRGGAAKPRKRRVTGDDGTPLGASAKRARLAKSASRARLGGGADGDDDAALYRDDLDAVSDDDMPDDFMVSEDEEVPAYQGPSRARRRAWQRIKYWRRRAEAEERAGCARNWKT